MDELARLTKLESPDGSVEQWQRNAAGLPIKYTDALNRETNSTYNSQGDLSRIDYPSEPWT